VIERLYPGKMADWMSFDPESYMLAKKRGKERAA
jgi:hypothetical protein